MKAQVSKISGRRKPTTHNMKAPDSKIFSRGKPSTHSMKAPVSKMPRRRVFKLKYESHSVVIYAVEESLSV